MTHHSTDNSKNMKLDYVLERLERVTQKNDGNYIACCPAHEDENPSLSVFINENKIYFKCWAGCTWQEVIECLKTGVVKNKDKIKPFIKKQNDDNLKFINICNAPEVAKNYLYVTRKIPIELSERYKIQFSTQGKYKNRLILPVYKKDELIYFQGRGIFHWQEPRYLNATKEETGYGSSEIVFNLENVEDNCIIFEGFFNALAYPKNGVSIFSKNCTPKQLQLLTLNKFKKYIVFLDYDALRQSLKLCADLIAHGCANVYLTIMKEGDANSNPEQARQCIIKAHKMDWFKIKRALLK